jgi:hypothetical protein
MHHDDLPVAFKEREKYLRVTEVIIPKLSDEENRSMLAWANGLLDIRNSNLPTVQKSKAAIRLTAQQRVVWPVIRLLAAEVKRIGWDERSTKARLGLAGATIGAMFFGGQSAGIAALGTAIGVPLWVVLGAGATFAGVLIEELKAHLERKGRG